ncbi:Uncharacterised protein [Ectopseudomonas mendocina]|nr:Uncharacterised protein [Pseudomonas mendocina]
MPLAPLRNDSTHPPERAIRAPETSGLIRLPWWFAVALLLPEHSHLHLSYPGFRRVQSPPRRANGIVVEEVERHGCRESRDGPGMALRGGPLERRWSERTPAQPGPDDRAEGFGDFCPQKLLAREGETKDIIETLISSLHTETTKHSHKFPHPASSRCPPCGFPSSCLHAGKVACYRSNEMNRGDHQMDDYQEELLDRDALDQDGADVDDATEL